MHIESDSHRLQLTILSCIMIIKLIRLFQQDHIHGLLLFSRYVLQNFELCFQVAFRTDIQKAERGQHTRGVVLSVLFDWRLVRVPWRGLVDGCLAPPQPWSQEQCRSLILTRGKACRLEKSTQSKRLSQTNNRLRSSTLSLWFETP